MADALTHAHLEAQRRLRVVVANAVAALWGALPGYEDGQMDQWLSGVVPLVGAAQRRSVAQTDAYLARVRHRSTLGLDPVALSGAAVRAGASPEEVYARSFHTVWTDLGEHKPWVDAVAAGLARAKGTATMDVQLSHRAALAEGQRADPAIRGYVRVADGGACAFCASVDGAFVLDADAMPLHNGCGCGLEPLLREVAPSPLPDDVAVHDHGELGPMLVAPDVAFTGPGDL